MIYHKDFLQRIRDYLKDADTDATANIPQAELSRAVLAGIRKIQTLFPEARMDDRGRLAPVVTAPVTEAQAVVQVGGDYPKIPIPDEFEAVLEGFVLAWAHSRDSNDVKDESLAKHWNNRFADMAGLPRL